MGRQQQLWLWQRLWQWRREGLWWLQLRRRKRLWWWQGLELGWNGGGAGGARSGGGGGGAGGGQPHSGQGDQNRQIVSVNSVECVDHYGTPLAEQRQKLTSPSQVMAVRTGERSSAGKATEVPLSSPQEDRGATV